MSDSSPNIQFNYLYRDAGNYKSYGSVVFANPDNLPIPEVEEKIRVRLIDGEFFDPTKWKLTPITPENWDSELATLGMNLNPYAQPPRPQRPAAP